MNQVTPQKRGKVHFKWILAVFILTFVVAPQQAKGNKNSVSSLQQQKEGRLKGRITDVNGEPMPGATVLIAGSSRGVMADVNGNYVIDDVPMNTKLTVTVIGMEPSTIVYKGEKELNVILQAKADELDEVTVVAFGKQKKESVLASISTIKPGELKVPSSNLTTAFAGRVAGLISYQRSGEPGQDNASFFIRGITTFGADAKKDPLILIDGVELSTEDLARMNTDDIASFSIMKDATATALYGARGANGVILVTTKQGKEGKAQVNIRLENSLSAPTQKVSIADPITYMRMQNEAIKTRDPMGMSAYTEEKITMTEQGRLSNIYPSTDWYKSMFNDNTTNQRANLSISGGGTVARYYVAANVSQDNGNLKVDDRNNFNSNIKLVKYAIRSNVNINLSKSTEMIIRLSSTFDEYTGPLDGGAEMYNKVMQANPVLFKPYYEPDEQFAFAKHILFGNSGDAKYINPYAESLKGYRDYSKNLMLTQFELKQNLNSLVKGLSARTMVNMNRYSEYAVTRQYVPYFYDISTFSPITGDYKLKRIANGEEYIGYTPGNRLVNTIFYLEAAADYNRTFNEKNNVSGLLVYTMRQEKHGLSDNLQLSLPNRNMGVSGRMAYNYDTRYFGEINFGYNGSERFSKNNRWGLFPSVGAAWMLSNEAFFQGLSKYITTLKFKGTYGMVGNDAIGSNNDRFYYLSQVNMNAGKWVGWGSQLDYNPGGVTIDRYANDQIGWEKSYKTNVGFELVLKNGFSSNVDFFKEKRENILLDRVIPSTMGILPAVKANLGKAQGQGVDIETNYEKFYKSGLWFTGRATFTYATSKVMEWEEPDYSKTPWLSKVNTKISQQWGLIAERLFVDELEIQNSPVQFGEYMAGDIKYHDVNGDGKISDLDQVPIGFPTEPEINYGFGLSTGYKGFDASFFFQGSGRQSFWLDLNKVAPFIDANTGDGLVGQNAILSVFADDYWSEGNRNAYALWPRLANYQVSNNNRRSTWFMQDASFIRLKSVEVGYTLPKKVMKNMGLSNLRVYASGTNLFCWSVFKLWDPEMAGNGLGYPLQRVINVGLNLGF